MPRPRIHPQPVKVIPATHSRQLIASAMAYAAAAHRYQAARQAGNPQHMARVRFLQVCVELDQLLSSLVLRGTRRRQQVSTGTEAARIKAAARALADSIGEAPPVRHQAHRTLLALIHETLAARAEQDHATEEHNAPQDATAPPLATKTLLAA